MIDIAAAARALEGESPAEILAWAAATCATADVRDRLRRRRLRDHRSDRARAAADRRVHARYRPAVPRDLRAVAARSRRATASRSARCARRTPSSSKPRTTARRCGRASRIAAASSARSCRCATRSPGSTRGSPRSAATRPPERASARGRRARSRSSASSRSTRSSAWTHDDVWGHLYAHDVPYNPLHERGYPSIGCQPCTSAIVPGENLRAGRWRGASKKRVRPARQPARAGKGRSHERAVSGVPEARRPAASSSSVAARSRRASSTACSPPARASPSSRRSRATRSARAT